MSEWHEAARRVAGIIQPSYIPWIGFFAVIRQSDVWVWYDDVQYTKRDWRNRNRIAADTAAEWLTIPVKTKGRYTQRICEVEIDNAQPWTRRHLKTIRRCYRRAPFFEAAFSIFEDIFASPDAHLADLTIRLNERICALIGLTPQFLRSSRMEIRGSDRLQRLLDVCGAVSATAYISGPAARSYIDPAAFAAAGVELRYMLYDYPRYPRGGMPFVPNLSILDALVWLGPQRTAEYLDAYSQSSCEVTV